MKEIWAKSNIYLLTFAGGAVAVWMALSWGSIAAGQKALGFFAVGMVLHEWEEARFPGGFYELMARKFGIGPVNGVQMGLSHGAVAIAVFLFAFLPLLLWDVAPWLAGVPVILGVFEAFIHVAGVKIHGLSRPHTPGMATALAWLLPCAVCIVVFAMPGVPAWQWLLALACYLVVFAGMEVGVWKSLGVDPRTMPQRMRSMASGR